MRIPNKFNGYSADNIRLYNDPVTLTAIAAGASGAGTMAGGAALAGAAAGTAAAAAPIATGAALGLGAGAGLGTGTMAGTMLGAGTTGAGLAPVLGSTAGLGAANTAALGGAGILQGAVPADVAAGLTKTADTTAALTPEQVNAMGTTNQMANVPTQLSPEQLAEGQKTMQMQNAMQGPSNQEIASKVAAQQPNQFVEGIMQSDVGQMAKTGYDALSSGFDTAMNFAQKNPIKTAVALNTAQKYFNKPPKEEEYEGFKGSIEAPSPTTAIYNPIYKPTAYAVGGPVERMSAANSTSGNTTYPMAGIHTPMYSDPTMQRPEATNVIKSGVDTNVDPYTGQERFAKGGEVNPYLKQLQKEERDRKEQADSMYESMQAKGIAASKTARERSRTQSTSSPYEAAIKEFQALSKKYKIPVVAPAKTSVDVMGEPETDIYAANGGIMHGLGGYSDGGRLLRGPGDGVSDSIPAVIGRNQPARLADGEFVVPARIVSELGNGSTEAGARQLYAMMERIQKARRKSVGKGKVAVNSKAKKHLPA
jgi:hypothetical protein